MDKQFKAFDISSVCADQILQSSLHETARKLALGTNDLGVKGILDLSSGEAFRKFSEEQKAMLARVCPSSFDAEFMNGVLLNQAMQSQFDEAVANANAFAYFNEPRDFLKDSVAKLHEYEAKYRSSFCLPDNNAVSLLLQEYKASSITALAGLPSDYLATVQNTIASMNAPWLDSSLAQQSMAGFVEMQGIGAALKSGYAFQSDFTTALRVDLGDWRDPITWHPDTFADSFIRVELYVERGLQPSLIDFPEEAFEESIEKAGLKSNPPPLEALFGPPIPPSNEGEDELNFSQNRQAYDWLFRFETQIRRFIDAAMSAAIGSNWPRQRIPNDMYERWNAKKEATEHGGGQRYPLIAYADFGDYETIISRNDNWKEVFAQFFHRKESIRESLQRLYPIRNTTMHSRPIVQADYLMLYVEVQRISKVFMRNN
jgi:Swt1-like HEPN